MAVCQARGRAYSLFLGEQMIEVHVKQTKRRVLFNFMLCLVVTVVIKVSDKFENQTWQARYRKKLSVHAYHRAVKTLRPTKDIATNIRAE